MTCLYFRMKTLVFLLGIVVLFLASAWESGAQNDALTTLSGRVIDAAGQPIAGLTVVIVPVQDGHGAWFPIEFEVEEGGGQGDPMAFQGETDAEGRFVITDAIVGPVLLGLFPYNAPEAEILRVQIGDLFLYAPDESWGRGVIFSAEPGDRIENVEVTVQRFLQLRAKVLRMDGSPLANAQRIRVGLRQLSLDGEYDGSGRWSAETDDEGNFVGYMTRYMNSPAFYFMSVTYQEHQVQLDPIVVKPEDLFHEVVFTFEVPLPLDMPRNAPPHFHAGASARVGGGLDAGGVWVVNPANGHAYKKVPFSGVEDAIAQAAKEGAYLVAINDEAEQNWLEQVFVAHRTLIGLSDVQEEGQWQWHSGEPVTYTNWATDEPHDTDKGDEDYVILFAAQWVDIGPGDIRWKLIQSALLEKEEVPLKK
ncbi:MAG: lectin-like protein [Candidatus Poribacteria bacterium]|nr:lectin-like protein [Candidatus Poribacteria bacterium]